MGFSLSEMWGHMGWPAITVAAVLLVMGLASLTVFIERVLTMRRSRIASAQFAAESGGHLREDMLETVIAEAEKYPDGHLPRVVKTALVTYRHARDTADVSQLSPAERTRRHMERYMEDVGADLRRGLAVLASVGSVAPFVGLLGTVLGIISAFQGIASTGSGGLSAVSSGISEALIETALGLAVAIPSVLGFNYLSTQVARDEAALNGAAGEVLDSIEGWAEAELHRDIPVDLPGIFNPDPDVEANVDAIKVTVKAPGQFHVDADQYDLEGVIQFLSDQHQRDPYRRLVLRGDSHLRYGEIRQFMARSQQIGFPGLNFM